MAAEAVSVARVDDEDEEATAIRAREDRTAFATLYIRHREAVFRYLRARCSSDDDAQELTAITFERALAAIPRYSSRGGGIAAWLLRIARNAVIDQERRRRPLLLPQETPARISPYPTPEEAAIFNEERRLLRGLLAELPQLQRDAIALRFGTGLSARQISLVINKSEEATQKLLTRAIARLKERVS